MARALTMLDVYTREAVAIEVRQSLKGRRCGADAEPDETGTWSAEGVVL